MRRSIARMQVSGTTRRQLYEELEAPDCGMAKKRFIPHAKGYVHGAGFILWQCRHMAYHVMLGLLWAWVLREVWNELNPLWIWTAAIGSVLPDIDHLNYWFGYGRNDPYTKAISVYFKKREWRELFLFIATRHKTNTSLAYHNIYVVGIFAALSAAAMALDWQIGVVLFGAIVSHYIFDIADDIVQLGELNVNWRRWGKPNRS